MHDRTKTMRDDCDAGAFLNGDLHPFEADFEALNNSGVSGRAYVLLDMDTRTVTLDTRADGMEPSQIHPQHVHGCVDAGHARTPVTTDDADRDGFVETGRGPARLERFHRACARRNRSSHCFWRIFHAEPRTLRLRMR